MAVTTSMGSSSMIEIATVTGAWQLVKMKINNLSGESFVVYGEQNQSETRIIKFCLFRNRQTGSAGCKDNICPPGKLDFVREIF